MAITDLRPGSGGGGGGPAGPSLADGWIVDELTLLAGDITAESKNLTKIPAVANRVKLSVINGLGSYDYAIDYQMLGATATLSWAGLGLAGQLSAGEILKVTYTTLTP